jgi:5-methyltetrahydropteroyltriglutamate--homocysteine methyltransferase
MAIPTEPIGSVPRPAGLLDAIMAQQEGRISESELETHYVEATLDTLRRFEATGSPVLTDGEQRKTLNFASYAVKGLTNFAPDGLGITFVDGHVRRLPRLVSGPFRCGHYAHAFLEEALRYTRLPVKQAVISPSALSLLYPPEGLADYSREAFLDDVLREHALDMRRCLEKGAHKVQIDFTEGRLAVKLDPSGHLLNSFIELNSLALAGFSPEERSRIGVHTCPGSDQDSTHSADVDYAELLPSLFELEVGNFYIAMAREVDRIRALRIIRRYLKPGQRVFLGVIDPIHPRIEEPEEVRDRVLEAAEFIPIEQLGTTDDCGFAPFCDDTTTSRDTAFAKIKARVEGTALAARVLGA